MSSLTVKKWRTFCPVYLLGIIAIVISSLTRILLLCLTGGAAGSPGAIAGGLLIGLVYDLIVAGFVMMPLLLYTSFLNEWIYRKANIKWVLLSGASLTAILLFSGLIPKDYNKDLYKAFLIFIAVRWLIYGLLAYMGASFRRRWRNVMTAVIFAISVFLLLFNAVSEIFFWLEFSSRYNFIAVDYLVYTNEVLGNIEESYPLTLIVTVILAVTIIILIIFRRKIRFNAAERLSFIKRVLLTAGMIVTTFLLARVTPPEWQYFSGNNYENELAGNGLYDFVQAFKKNELDFYQYYKTLPDSEAFQLVRNELNTQHVSSYTSDSTDILRHISYDQPEKKMNVVLISVESFSADFMAAFGNKSGLTPCLDSLAQHGLLFTNLYAAGTRTVRGLEAISLAIPPLPGQSLVKRPDNADFFSLGSVFNRKGYVSQYIYGGYSYFDNMQSFFSANHYQVIDRSALRRNEVHYANIWGVADEDLFSLTLRELDSNYQAHRPFFSHIMTVSNHRPFTYPEGRIDIPPSSQSRDGAVKYTDYSIGQFLKQAATRPWFNNTLFVIVADHCASSAGKTALPVTGYHIPMIMYSPANITPGTVSTLTSQLDIAPSILGFLNASYDSRFFGRDVFHDSSSARAVISTYQGLGMISGDTLIVQSPKKNVTAYQVNFATGEATQIKGDERAMKKAIAFYQVAAWMVKNKKFRSLRYGD
ncbi:MAG: sulfatase [Citrobacter freundii]|nr:MAG: sulfatase [Citrobacter freundii]